MWTVILTYRFELGYILARFSWKQTIFKQFFLQFIFSTKLNSDSNRLKNSIRFRRKLEFRKTHYLGSNEPTKIGSGGNPSRSDSPEFTKNTYSSWFYVSLQTVLKNTHLLFFHLQDALDNLVSKLDVARQKWEHESTMIQAKNKNTLLEFGLNPLDIWSSGWKRPQHWRLKTLGSGRRTADEPNLGGKCRDDSVADTYGEKRTYEFAAN